MRAVVQRVSRASVAVQGEVVASISQGLLVLIGFAKADTQADADYIIRKIINMRIFDDDAGKMNKSLQDVQGEVLLVSQFTLYANTRKGNRPSFVDAMPPAEAKVFYDGFVQRFQKEYKPLKTGVFAADMAVSLINDGPITIILES